MPDLVIGHVELTWHDHRTFELRSSGKWGGTVGLNDASIWQVHPDDGMTERGAFSFEDVFVVRGFRGNQPFWFVRITLKQWEAFLHARPAPIPAPVQVESFDWMELELSAESAQEEQEGADSEEAEIPEEEDPFDAVLEAYTDELFAEAPEEEIGKGEEVASPPSSHQALPDFSSSPSPAPFDPLG